MLEILREAIDEGLIRNLDYYFAQHIAELDGHNDPVVPLASALVSLAVGGGNVCLDLQAVAGTTISAMDGETSLVTVPNIDDLIGSLNGSPVVGSPGTEAPLILDEADRLYLGRYWWFEQQVAEMLLARARPVDLDEIDQHLLRRSLQRMFPTTEGETDWQMIAAAMAVLRQFAVISGGPGTGKTRTVITILALLLEQAGDNPLNIALAAPTGKAAARLTESIRLSKQSITCAEAVRALIPEEATTIHRLLGVRPGKVEPRHHAGNPLQIDLLVVDEASMIDLPLMARLLAALPAHARLILLGDKDQLASVEAGSVYADISAKSEGAAYSKELVERLKDATGQKLDIAVSEPAFSDCIAILHKSYRFADDKGVGALARAINGGKSDEAMVLLQNSQHGITYRAFAIDDIHVNLAEQVMKNYVSCFDAATPRDAIERFNAFRILCAVRGGPAGVEQVNQLVERILRTVGRIQGSGLHYKGRPIMVTRNDYNLGLFNGDVGIIWPDPEADNALRAWFILPDNSVKRVLTSRLSEHETAYAMTVHKSQGSEFERILMLMPYEMNEVLTRELLYTGITRAKKRVEVWGSADVIKQCINSKVRRVTGLSEKLYACKDQQ